MKVREYIGISLIVFLLVVIFKSEMGSKISYIETPGDSVFTEIIKEVPVPYDTIIYDIDTLWLSQDTIKLTDTVFVYNDYFKMYSYKDTIKNDSSMTIVRNLQITQNKLYKEQYFTKNNRKTELIMTKDNSFGVGIIVGAQLTAPIVSYEFKNHQIGAGYNFSNSGVVFMYQYKFDFK